MADSNNNSQPLRVKICLQGYEIVVSSDDKPPLGLRLEKMQSFLDKIAAEMAVEKLRATAGMAMAHHNVNSIVQQRLIETQLDPYQLQFQHPPQCHHYHQPRPPMPNKLKASNLAAMFIKIGSWQRTAMNEGEVVAKFYYAKKKIVWEVLDGALKSKIEMRWSDIEGIKATIFHDDLQAHGVLELELNQPPQFFREKNPLPRTHTLWDPSEDFTGGQAPMYRRHLIKFPGGVLNKHYEKLLQCDPRLLELSRRPFPRMDSPYFYLESTFNVATCNDGILFNSGLAREAHSSHSHMREQYLSAFPHIVPPSSVFLVSSPNQLVQNPNPVHSLMGSNPPQPPLSGNFQAPLGIALGFPPLSNGRIATAYENLVNDNRNWHRGTPSIVENNNIFYSRAQDQIQRLPPFPNPLATAPQAFLDNPTTAFDYGEDAPNTESTLDDIRHFLQWDSLSLSLNQRLRPMMSSSMETFRGEINAPSNSRLNAQLQQQCQPEELFHGEIFRADGGLLYPQPFHSFPPHISDDENAMTSPPDDDDTDYALSHGGHGTQPQQ